MERAVAEKLFEIYKLEKEMNRGIYPEELWTRGICTKHQIQPLFDALMSVDALVEESYRGANIYRISNIGYAQMESYLDIKREL